MGATWRQENGDGETGVGYDSYYLAPTTLPPPPPTSTCSNRLCRKVKQLSERADRMVSRLVNRTRKAVEKGIAGFSHIDDIEEKGQQLQTALEDFLNNLPKSENRRLIHTVGEVEEEGEDDQGAYTV